MFLKTLNFSLLLSLVLVLQEGLSMAKAHISLSGHGHLDRACTKDDKRYLIKLYAHLDKGVIDAIKSASIPAIQDHGTGREAISSYLGTIIDSYNDYLNKFKVEIELDLNAFDVNDFLVTKGFDNSCEVVDPAVARTKAAHDYFLETYKEKIGIHLFLWSCPFRSERMADKVVIGEPNGCARSIGVMWDGTDGTVDYIKSTITEAISGAKDLFLNGNSPNLDEEHDLSYVCQYADKCVVSVPSANGVIIFGSDDFRNTAPISTTMVNPLNGVYIPAQSGSMMQQRVMYSDEPSNSHDNDCKY